MAQLLCFRIQIVHNKQEEKHLEVCLTRNQQLQELEELGKLSRHVTYRYHWAIQLLEERSAALLGGNKCPQKHAGFWG